MGHARPSLHGAFNLHDADLTCLDTWIPTQIHLHSDCESTPTSLHASVSPNEPTMLAKDFGSPLGELISTIPIMGKVSVMGQAQLFPR